MTNAVHVHLPPYVREALDAGGDSQFYGPLLRTLRGAGAAVTVVPAEDRVWQDLPAGGDPAGRLHVIHNGRLRAPNVLNAAIAYLDRWWHLDPMGVLCMSSVAGDRFDPAAMRRRPSRRFLDALRARHVAPRRSRYGQPREVVPVPEGCIALFLQGRTDMTRMARRHPTPAMIRATVRGAGGRPVRVKPHPQRSHVDELLVVAELAEDGFDVGLFEGNVHDLLAACCATVSISSACSFEGFLHRKPAILFGRSDFHHHAQTVAACTPEAFAAALEAALRPVKTYARYVDWYLRGHCLHADDPALGDRILQRLAAIGWDRARLAGEAAA